MPPTAVKFHPAAVEEAAAAYEWYAQRSLIAARGFREELRHAVEAVAKAPDRWPRYGARAQRYLFLRSPFSLVYRLRDGEVEVLAVAHGKRRPGYWATQNATRPVIAGRLFDTSTPRFLIASGVDVLTLAGTLGQSSPSFCFRPTSTRPRRRTLPAWPNANARENWSE